MVIAPSSSGRRTLHFCHSGSFRGSGVIASGALNHRCGPRLSGRAPQAVRTISATRAMLCVSARNASPASAVSQGRARRPRSSARPAFTPWAVRLMLAYMVIRCWMRRRTSRTSMAWPRGAGSTAVASAGSPGDEARAKAAACSPAILPMTWLSMRALPPGRFAPCWPPAASPQAKRPGTVVAARVSILMPPWKCWHAGASSMRSPAARSMPRSANHATLGRLMAFRRSSGESASGDSVSRSRATFGYFAQRAGSIRERSRPAGFREKSIHTVRPFCISEKTATSMTWLGSSYETGHEAPLRKRTA